MTKNLFDVSIARIRMWTAAYCMENQTAYPFSSNMNGAVAHLGRDPLQAVP